MTIRGYNFFLQQAYKRISHLECEVLIAMEWSVQFQRWTEIIFMIWVDVELLEQLMDRWGSPVNVFWVV